MTQDVKHTPSSRTITYNDCHFALLSFRSKQYAFQVVVLGRSPLFFACDNELLRSEWIDVFMRYNDELVDQALSHERTSPEGGPAARQARHSQNASVYVDMKNEEGNHRPSISGTSLLSLSSEHKLIVHQ